MDKNLVITDKIGITHGRGYCYSLQYYFVWCTSSRQEVFTGALAAETTEFLRKSAESLEMNILSLDIQPDYINILADCKPQLRPSDAIKIMKGNTARWLFLSHPELKSSLPGGHLWNSSYFVATMSDRSPYQIQEYLQTQKTR